jgi:DNA polymerase-3 subunit epsilon
MTMLAALDFETASNERDSVCAVGACRLGIDGRIESRSWLVRPPEMHFLAGNVRLHRITPDMVERCDEFPGVWPEIRDFIAPADELWAHYAPFDSAVVRAVWSRYGLPDAAPSLMCTWELACATVPQLPKHDLPSVCRLLGIGLEHHQAASDAEACALIALSLRHRPKIAEAATATAELLHLVQDIMADGVVDIEEVRQLCAFLYQRPELRGSDAGCGLFMLSEHILEDGIIEPAEALMVESLLRDLWGIDGALRGILQSPQSAKPAFWRAPTATTTPPKDTAATCIEFAGKVFCFTGDFAFGDREQCQASTAKAGGTIKTGVSRKVDYLVAGALGGWGAKLDQAGALSAGGHRIAVVNECDWAKALVAARTP